MLELCEILTKGIRCVNSLLLHSFGKFSIQMKNNLITNLSVSMRVTCKLLRTTLIYVYLYMNNLRSVSPKEKTTCV